MDLKTYLSERKMPAYELAQKANISNTTIHNILKGRDFLISIALKIEKATKGKVKIRDMLPKVFSSRKGVNSKSKKLAKNNPKRENK